MCKSRRSAQRTASSTRAGGYSLQRAATEESVQRCAELDLVLEGLLLLLLASVDDGIRDHSSRLILLGLPCGRKWARNVPVLDRSLPRSLASSLGSVQRRTLPLTESMHHFWARAFSSSTERSSVLNSMLSRSSLPAKRHMMYCVGVSCMCFSKWWKACCAT